MKYTLFILTLFTLVGCTTTAIRMVDPQNRDYTTKFDDTRHCKVLSGGDQTYVNECLTKKGYKFESYEKSVYDN